MGDHFPREEGPGSGGKPYRAPIRRAWSTTGPKSKLFPMAVRSMMETVTRDSGDSLGHRYPW